MKKITIYTNHYYPENFRINEISEYLSKYFQISVVTQIPNYPKGKFYKGYKSSRLKKFNKEDIYITRLPVIPRGRNPIMLALNYITYIISSTIYSLFNNDDTDYVFTYITSPIFIAWAGIRTAKKQSVPHIMYLLDLWPDSLLSVLNIKNKTVKNLLIKMCKNIYNKTDKIIVSSQSFIDVLVDYGVEKSKIIFIPQHAEDAPILEHQSNSNQKETIVFTGNIGEAQGLDVLVDCAILLKVNNFKNVVFKIVGDGRYKQNLENHVQKSGVCSYFKFVGRVDSTLIPEILAQSDFAFISLKDSETFNKTLPAKLQTYLAFGMPIIGCANGEVARTIRKSQSGFSVPAGDAESLAELIMNLGKINEEERETLSRNAVKYARTNYNKDLVFGKLKAEIVSTNCCL